MSSASDAKTGQPIFGYRNVGVKNVGSYQVSGWPWITGSVIGVEQELKVSFPMVTKSITVIQSGSESIRAHFVSTSSGDVVLGHHYIATSNSGDSVTFNVKCKEIYVSSAGLASGYELFAELTNIPTASMFDLPASGHTSLE